MNSALSSTYGHPSLTEPKQALAKSILRRNPDYELALRSKIHFKLLQKLKYKEELANKDKQAMDLLSNKLKKERVSDYKLFGKSFSTFKVVAQGGGGTKSRSNVKNGRNMDALAYLDSQK